MRYESFFVGELPQSVVSTAVEYSATMRRAMSDGSYALLEASLRLPFDEKRISEVRSLAAKLAGPELLYILNIGIGGSCLGARAVYDAIAGTLDAHLPLAPKMLFADTCSPDLLSDIAEVLLSEISKPEELVIVIASKSGTTTETIVNASILVSALEARFGSLAGRIVCITDTGSPLWELGESKKFHLLDIPKNVGGRYSVFSPVGLFPLACAGIDVNEIVRGAQTAVSDTVERGIESNAFRAAWDVFFAAQQKNTVVFDTFVFHPELESLGKWCRQLIGESIGKSTKRDGTPANHRIAPTVSVGTTDLHSVEQMCLADPHLAFRFLVRAHAPHWEHRFTANDTTFAPLVPGVSGRAPCQVMDAVYDGVVATYRARGVGFSETTLSDINPESLGEFLQTEMCMVMYLASLLDVNAFDQPNVEEYKSATRKILAG